MSGGMNMEEALKEIVTQLKHQNEALVAQNQELFKMITSKSAGSGDKNLNKMEKPDKFSGGRDATHIENWVYSVKQYTKALKLTGEDAVTMAVSFLDGLAKQYWRSYSGKLEREKAANLAGDYSVLYDLDQMLELMRQRFYPNELVQNVRNQLEKLEQTSSARVYAQKFEALLMQLPIGDYSELDMVDKFIRGLKFEVQKHVLLDGPANLLAAIQSAERVDGILFQLKNGGRKQPQSPSRQFHPQRQMKTRDPYEMDVDSVETRKPDFKKRNGNSRGPLKCYRCDRLGHMAKNCNATVVLPDSAPKPADAGNGLKN